MRHDIVAMGILTKVTKKQCHVKMLEGDANGVVHVFPKEELEKWIAPSDTATEKKASGSADKTTASDGGADAATATSLSGEPHTN